MAKSYHLVVRHDFGDYKRGARIEDAKEIERIEKADLHAHVVRVALPEDDTLAPKLKAKAKAQVAETDDKPADSAAADA